MLSFLKRSSQFARALAEFGLSRCSMTNGQLLIGLPPNSEYKRTPVEIVPDSPKFVLFVEGPEQTGLVTSFAASPEAAAVEH